MFINIICVILCLYTVFTPFMYVYCIKFGVRLGASPEKEAEKPVIKPKKKPSKPTEEEKRLQADLEAINGFDGF